MAAPRPVELGKESFSLVAGLKESLKRKLTKVKIISNKNCNRSDVDYK